MAQTLAQTQKQPFKEARSLPTKDTKTIVEQTKINKNGEGTERRRPPGADPQKRAHLAKGICIYIYIYIYIYVYVFTHTHICTHIIITLRR